MSAAVIAKQAEIDTALRLYAEYVIGGPGANITDDEMEMHSRYFEKLDQELAALV